MLVLSVGLGLLISLLFSEFLGLAAGGMVVPGYIALALNRPTHLAGTFVAALIAFGALRLLSRYAIVYGRRRLVIVLLFGFLAGYALQWVLRQDLGMPQLTAYTSVGFIIPGLLAFWMERQGVLETTCSLAIAATMVRLMLILANGGHPVEMAF